MTHGYLKKSQKTDVKQIKRAERYRRDYLAQKGASVGVIEKMSSVGRGQNRAAIGGIRATHSDPAKIKICLRSIDIAKRFEDEHGIDIDWLQGGYLFPVYDEERETALKNLLTFQKNTTSISTGYLLRR